MSRVSSSIRDITPARRGQIVQHVIVDGWSPAQAAAAYGVAERQVARWVAAYRRHGMASLRDEATASPLRWRRQLRALAARISAALYGGVGARPAGCVTLRRQSDRDRRPDPDRRSLWN